MKFLTLLGSIGALAWNALRSQVGAFEITNKNFASRIDSFLPAVHNELADQTASTAVVDTGIVGLKWARVKVRVKTFGTLVAGDTLIASLQVGTGAAITNPENIAQKFVVVETGDTSLVFEMIGSSENGFQSYNVLFTAAGGHTFTADLMVDAT